MGCIHSLRGATIALGVLGRSFLGRARGSGGLIAVGVVSAVAGAEMTGCSYGTVQPATNVTATSATLHGQVASDTDEGSTYWFEYGKTTAFETKTPERTTDP